MNGLNGQKISLRKAMEIWQEQEKTGPSEAKEVNLNFWLIDKLETSALMSLTNCTKLVLVNNCIPTMIPFDGMKSLEILALSRNMIRRIGGLEQVGATLKQLWLSYNLIQVIGNGLNSCVVLEVFLIGHNLIKDWAEVDRLKDLSKLTTISLAGNEIHEKYEKNEGEYRLQCQKRVPQLQIIDGKSSSEERLKLQEMDSGAD
jgi:dynein light chain 1